MPTRLPSTASLDELRAQLAAAEDELEDVRLFRPQPQAIEEAQRRLNELRAAVAGFRPAAQTPAVTPTPSESETLPAARERLRRAEASYADRLRDAWFIQVARMESQELPRFLRAVRPRTVDELRLAEGGWLVLRRVRAARALRARIDALEPDRVPPTGLPPPLRESPAKGGVLVDVHDGLTQSERAVLRALQALGARQEGQPKSAKLVRQYVEEHLGMALSLEELSTVLEQIGPGAPAPLLETFQPTGAEPIVRMTALASLVIGNPPDPSEPISRPLRARVPYLLLSGRLGSSEIPLPWTPTPLLNQAWRRIMEHSVDLLPWMLKLPRVVSSTSLNESEGVVVLAAEVNAEAGRAEGRARLMVTELPPTASWTAARDHLNVLLERRYLEGVTEVRLVATPARVWLEVDLEHVIFTNLCMERVDCALRVVFHVHQHGLLGGRVVALTPLRALDAFLEHRLETEAMGSEPTFQRLRHKLELLEATLVGIELAEPLTELLRRCDAVPNRPEIALWALNNVPICASDPELASFSDLETRWPAALAAVTSRIESELEGWAPSQSLAAGFPARLATAFVNGRAFRRATSDVLRELVETNGALVAERVSVDFGAVRKHVAADLDTLNVASWRRT